MSHISDFDHLDDEVWDFSTDDVSWVEIFVDLAMGSNVFCLWGGDESLVARG
jgi:hypothetical protein